MPRRPVTPTRWGTKQNPWGFAPGKWEGEGGYTFGLRNAELTWLRSLLATSPQPPSSSPAAPGSMPMGQGSGWTPGDTHPWQCHGLAGSSSCPRHPQGPCFHVLQTGDWERARALMKMVRGSLKNQPPGSQDRGKEKKKKPQKQTPQNQSLDQDYCTKELNKQCKDFLQVIEPAQWG